MNFVMRLGMDMPEVMSACALRFDGWAYAFRMGDESCGNRPMQSSLP